MTLTALINDTTGTLLASHYVNPRTKIAVIFGTGCNAAYMEHVKDIPKINNLGIDPGDDMAINCEWVRCDVTPDFEAFVVIIFWRLGRFRLVRA